MRISDWSSDVFSSDLGGPGDLHGLDHAAWGRAGTVVAVAPSLQEEGIKCAAAPRASFTGRRRTGTGPATPRRRSASTRPPPRTDRKSTRLNSVTNAQLVCRLLHEKKKH